jgi:ribonuclease PH
MARAMASDKRGGRPASEPRPVEITLGFQRLAEGSVLYRAERTVVLVTASVDEHVPKFLEGTGRGWLTAEYQMHPRANPMRREARDGRNKPPSGRTKEIERLIGRGLRPALDMDVLGERTVAIDCDVLEADGGTRTACVTAAWLALAMAAEKLYVAGKLKKPLLCEQVASLSVGLVNQSIVLDLCYAEDSGAEVDMNVVGTAKGALIEVQGTAEKHAVPRATVDSMLDMAQAGIARLCQVQLEALAKAGVNLAAVLR